LRAATTPNKRFARESAFDPIIPFVVGTDRDFAYPALCRKMLLKAVEFRNAEIRRRVGIERDSE